MSFRQPVDIAVESDFGSDLIEIKIRCGDPYAAQVLYDDIAERLQAGETIGFGFQPKAKTEQEVA